MKIVALVLALLLSSGAFATTRMMPRGPAPDIEALADRNLVDLFVRASGPTPAYVPGQLQIYLSRDSEDFIRTRLWAEPAADGRMHARINLNPRRASSWLIYVYDQQKDGQLLLLSNERLDVLLKRSQEAKKEEM
jgi:hypothetical protein